MLSLFALLACTSGSSTGPGTTGKSPARPPITCPEGAKLTEDTRSDGTLEMSCSRLGQQHGPFLKFFADRTTRAEKGAYANGVQDGDWIWWHENSQERRKGRYSRGKEVGAWAWWYPNGNRMEEGDYLQGRKAGMWTTWYESGAKKEVGMYHNGTKHGTWTFFPDNPDEIAERTETWENGELKDSKPVVPKDGKVPTKVP